MQHTFKADKYIGGIKLILEKKATGDKKKHAKLPKMQRVNKHICCYLFRRLRN